jgi:16S rRNA C967 or C1407 C5-methylase (RsmB/RsmF family)
VVAALLKRSNGALELVRCDQRLPGFTFAAGLRTWKVVDEQMRPWASHAEFAAATAERQCATAAAARVAGGEQVVDEGRRYRRTMWAPKKDSKTAAALERCVRVYPHQQNTGGFFVAIIKKVRSELARWSPPSARVPCRT